MGIIYLVQLIGTERVGIGYNDDTVAHIVEYVDTPLRCGENARATLQRTLLMRGWTRVLRRRHQAVAEMLQDLG